MLRQILTEIEANHDIVCLRYLAERLDASPSAVEGMIETLISMGKLVEVSVHRGDVCAECSKAHLCTTIMPPTSERLFRLAGDR
jgi:hypothetical protein